MTNEDMIKVLPANDNFNKSVFIDERNASDDLVIRGESKLEREAMHALSAVDK